MKKIMFLTRSLNIGGAENQMVLLATGLHKRGYDVSVAVLYPGGPFQKKLVECGVKVHELRKRNRWDIFGFLLKLIALIKQESPDILHSYHVVPNLLTAILKKLGFKSKIVWGVRCSNMNLNEYDRMARLTFKASCFLSKYADLIIANSYSGMKYHQIHGYPKNTFKVIQNGIDTEKFTINLTSGVKLRNQWGISNNVRIIGIVGRLDPMKNYELFIEAAIKLTELKDDVLFVCVGDGSGEYKKKLQKISKSLIDTKRIIWLGPRTDMPEIYNAFDILTNCSHTEGFPNVIGEAMSAGVPCVVTDVGDSKEIVKGNGVVIDSANVESLVAGWMVMLDSILSMDNEKVRENIVINYSFKSLVDKTEVALTNLCET